MTCVHRAPWHPDGDGMNGEALPLHALALRTFSFAHQEHQELMRPFFHTSGPMPLLRGHGGPHQTIDNTPTQMAAVGFIGQLFMTD